MPTNQIIHLHCLCLNDAPLIPHLLRHYDSWVSVLHMWDRGSTDGTRELLSQHPKVILHDAAALDESDPLQDKQWFDSAWQVSRGQADWVLMAYANEHLYHPRCLAYLHQCQQEGVTAIRGIGFEMVGGVQAEQLTEAPLISQITQGCRSAALDRLCIFSPNELTETNYAPGLHQAWPRGHVVWPHEPEILMLRFEVMGDRPGKASMNAALWQEHAQNLRINAVAVPGLGDLSHIAPSEFRHDEKTISLSGLFDAHWYLERYTDVREQHIDPLVHFCHYGWKEARQPNAYFDTGDYSDRAGDLISQGVNPLLHYIQQGEASNQQPSAHFDTAWYRAFHHLPANESPLQHYLLRRQQGTVSPVADFDVVAYVDHTPHWSATAQDPYLHSLEAHSQADGQKPYGPTMTWANILASAGIDIQAGTMPASVNWDELQSIVRQFVSLLPFDERWYCKEYPDVGDAIANGEMPSAHDIFISNGFFEGRDGIQPEVTPENT